MIGALESGRLRHRSDLYPTVSCPAVRAGVRRNGTLRPEGGGEDKGWRDAFANKGTGHGQCTLRRQFPIIGKAAVSLMYGLIVCKATDHQHQLMLFKVA